MDLDMQALINMYLGTNRQTENIAQIDRSSTVYAVSDGKG